MFVRAGSDVTLRCTFFLTFTSNIPVTYMYILLNIFTSLTQGGKFFRFSLSPCHNSCSKLLQHDQFNTWQLKATHETQQSNKCNKQTNATIKQMQQTNKCNNQNNATNKQMQQSNKCNKQMQLKFPENIQRIRNSFTDKCTALHWKLQYKSKAEQISNKKC